MWYAFSFDIPAQQESRQDCDPSLDVLEDNEENIRSFWYHAAPSRSSLSTVAQVVVHTKWETETRLNWWLTERLDGPLQEDRADGWNTWAPAWRHMLARYL